MLFLFFTAFFVHLADKTVVWFFLWTAIFYSINKRVTNDEYLVSTYHRHTELTIQFNNIA
jgi:hypothetical protein